MSRLGLNSGPRIQGKFFEILESSLDSMWAGQIGMYFPSFQESESYKWLGFSPALREWVGGRQAKGLRSNGITIENKKFESTIEIGVDDIRRDKTGQIDTRIAELADRVNQHWAKLLTTLIINGGSGVCYDSQYFFDTDHSEGDSGTLKNLLTASEVTALNVSTAAAPTAAELMAAVLGLVAYMYSFKDDQGEPFNENARQFMLMVPTNMWASALALASATTLNTGSGVIENVLQKQNELRVTPVCNPRLTTTTELYLFRTDGRAKPFILQEEEQIKTHYLDENSEHAMKNDACLFGVKTLRNVGYGYWQHAVKATLS